MLPLWARVDLKAISMKRYSIFLKTPALLEPHHQIAVSVFYSPSQVEWTLAILSHHNHLSKFTCIIIKYVHVYIFHAFFFSFIGSLSKWVECSPMVRETWVQSKVASYQTFLKWYLIPPCLTISNIRYVLRIKWSNPGKGVSLSPTPWCSSY